MSKTVIAAETGSLQRLTAATLSLLTRHFMKPFLASWVPVTVQRWIGVVAGVIFRSPRNVSVRQTTLAGLPCLELSPRGEKSCRSILYLHGGAFVMGGFGSHRKIAAWVAQSTQATVWLPDYRLAPEHACPAAVSDAVACFQELISSDQNPSDVVIAGDSAGGGLALATVLSLRDRGLLLPAGLMLLSPWVDLSLSGQSITNNAKQDDLLSRDWLTFGARAYASGTTTDNPKCSPLFDQLQGLPPLLIQAGQSEMLLDDARRLYDAVLAAGADVSFQEFTDCGHVFQLHAGRLHAADLAMKEIADFASTVYGSQNHA